MKKTILLVAFLGCFSHQVNAGPIFNLTKRVAATINQSLQDYIDTLRKMNPFMSYEEILEMAQDFYYQHIDVFNTEPNKGKNKKTGTEQRVGEDDVIPYSLY